MKFFVDNNLSPKLANGMAAFGEDVTHLQDPRRTRRTSTGSRESVETNGFY